MGSFIRMKATDLSGNAVEMKHEPPRKDPADKKSPRAVAYLGPSGKTYVHPLFKFAQDVGADPESIRPAHRGLDGKGNEGVSDQRWIFDAAEAAELKRQFPDRVILVEHDD